MFWVLQQYREKTSNYFPLKIKYALCFPDTRKISGNIPSGLDEKSIILFDDLNNLNKKLEELFGGKQKQLETRSIRLLIDKILAPTFKIYAGLDDQIEMFKSSARKILTGEQERILDETIYDKRKIFFGAAGTGKTFLAREKAIRLAKEGKKAFLTCFNKNLSGFLSVQGETNITTLNFHNYLEKILLDSGYIKKEDSCIDEPDVYYNEFLPVQAFDYFSNLPSEKKFDAVIVDEGQDFKEDWITCLESLLKEDGEFYIFADPNQDLFYSEIENLKKMEISKHRLTRNLRNTEEINKWMQNFVPEGWLKPSIPGGMPVVQFSWETPEEEKRLIEKELVRLINQGIKPERIVILSPNKWEKTSLAKEDKLKGRPVVNITERTKGTIGFSTIRSFKGLEADIVFLIGIKPGSLACTKSDVYVGGSRARFILNIFHRADWY